MCAKEARPFVCSYQCAYRQFNSLGNKRLLLERESSKYSLYEKNMQKYKLNYISSSCAHYALSCVPCVNPPTWSRLTLNTADSPQPGVGEIAPFGFGLRLGLVCGGIGSVADVRPRIEPVVRADGDGHQAEGGESPHGGQQRLHPAVTPSHGASY